MARIRTFVALRVGEGIAARLAHAARRLAEAEPGLKLTRPGDLHLTVQFLGPTEEAEVPAISRALAEAAAGTPPLAVRYGPLGAFPEPERARVVWARVAEEEDERAGALVALARAVGERLAPLDHAPEPRPFHAHVTLGRLRRHPRPGLVAALQAGASASLGEEVLSDLKLILSDPGGGRYRYIDLTTVRLGRTPPGASASRG